MWLYITKIKNNFINNYTYCSSQSNVVTSVIILESISNWINFFIPFKKSNFFISLNDKSKNSKFFIDSIPAIDFNLLLHKINFFIPMKGEKSSIFFIYDPVKLIVFVLSITPAGILYLYNKSNIYLFIYLLIYI